MNPVQGAGHITSEQARAALDAARGVALLRGVLGDPASHAMMTLLEEVSDPQPAPEAIETSLAAAFRALAATADVEPLEGVRDAWQAHLTALVLDDANPWSEQAERVGSDGVGRGMRAQAMRDLSALQRLFELDAAAVGRIIAQISPPPSRDASAACAGWVDLAGTSPGDPGHPARTAIRRRLASSRDWPEMAIQLERHWARHGTGLVGRFRALRWEGRAGGWRGIAHPDSIRLAELVGYEREQARLTANVERFLARLPAHHALLYGSPGTGKSSTVKAIANEYAGRGLRLVEVRKEDLHDLPAINALVRGRAPRFMLFVDDLSFEEDETHYKALKALLEGAAEARPENLLVYATTNRRNLVRESFADRGLPSDDVHGRDSLHEKISLAARFGLRVTFALPDQERYLAIALSLARGRGIDLPDDDLRARALAWERRHAGRSGRTARYFVDDLEAELRSELCT